MNSSKASFRAPLFVLIIYGLILLSRTIESKIASNGNIYLSLIILQILVFIIPSILFCRLRGVGYSVKLNIKPFSPGKLGCVVLAAIALISGSVVLRLFQISVFDSNTFLFSMYSKYLPANPSEYFLFCTMSFAVMPAIAEEFVFRSIVLSEYNNSGIGAVAASAVSSLLSSMIFFDLEQLPVFLLCGIVCSVVTYVTGSSLTAILTHMLFNIYGIFGEPRLIRAMINPSNRVITVFTAVLLFLILTVIFLGECEHIMYRAGINGVQTPSYRLKKTDDGTTPDIASTDAEDDDNDNKKRNGLILSGKFKSRMEVFFSPTFLMCILVFAVAVFGFN